MMTAFQMFCEIYMAGAIAFFIVNAAWLVAGDVRVGAPAIMTMIMIMFVVILSLIWPLPLWVRFRLLRG